MSELDFLESEFEDSGAGMVVSSLDSLTSEVPGASSSTSSSSSSGNKPSINPADEGTLVGTFRFILNKMLQDTNGMLPARVITYDRETNRAQVQPLIMVVTTDDSQVSRAPIAEVPVFQLGGGNTFVNFKILPGDLGWILANDRDISLFLQSYSESRPNTFRKNNFADSLFMPHLMTDYTVVDDDELAVIQNRAGTVRVALLEDQVRITAPLGLHVSGDITASGYITPHVPL